MHAEHRLVEQVKRRATSANADRVRAEFKAAIERLLQDPRLKFISADDIRYGWAKLGKADSLPALLKQWQGSANPSPKRRQFIEALEQGLQMTLREDIRSIAERLSDIGYEMSNAKDKAIEVFMARYGVTADVGPKLADLADAYQCTHQRITQILKRMIGARGDGSIASPAALTLVGQAKAIAKVAGTEDALSKALGLGPGTGHSLQVFRKFCFEVLQISDADVAALGQAEPQPAQKAKPRVAERTSAFLKRARQHCRASSAAHVPTLAGELALYERVELRLDDIRQVIDATPGTRWIDRAAGWFTFDDLEASFIHRRVREILAVARQPVGVNEIASALLANPKLNHAKQDGFLPVPPAVFRGVLLGWNGIVEDGWGRLTDKSGNKPEDLLSPAHIQIYNALAKRGGVARKADVVGDVTAGSAKNTVFQHIQQAPFVYTIGTGLYALLGWPLNDSTLLPAVAGAGDGDVVVVKRSGAA